MKLHCRTRKGNVVRLTFRDGTVHCWRFLAEHRAWLKLAEGQVEKRHLRAFCVLQPCRQQGEAA
jgi:hypothetical protein